MPRTFASTRAWGAEASRRFLDTVTRLGEAEYAGASHLPGWTRHQLIAHVAAHADTLRNLTRWAVTGERTPIHVTMVERIVDDERGAGMTPTELLLWLHRSNADLTAALAQLTDQHWTTEVATASGRIIPASEIPWLRARELWVHLVDLNVGVRFRDLPDDFLHALVADLVLRGNKTCVPDGPVHQAAEWLAGLSHDVSDAGPLGPWL